MNRLRQAVHQNGGKTLLGAAVYFYDPTFLEICAHLGYQVIWIEMEHGHITFCLLYTSPSPRDLSTSRMPSSA